MNPRIPRVIADEHLSDLRRQAARAHTGAHRHRHRSRGPRPTLRHRMGFAMIEAGTRMLATTQPATTE